MHFRRAPDRLLARHRIAGSLVKSLPARSERGQVRASVARPLRPAPSRPCVCRHGRRAEDQAEGRPRCSAGCGGTDPVADRLRHPCPHRRGLSWPASRPPEPRSGCGSRTAGAHGRLRFKGRSFLLPSAGDGARSVRLPGGGGGRAGWWRAGGGPLRLPRRKWCPACPHPEGIDQEIQALLVGPQLLRTAIKDATGTRPGTHPGPGRVQHRPASRPRPDHPGHGRHHRHRHRPGRHRRPPRPGRTADARRDSAAHFPALLPIRSCARNPWADPPRPVGWAPAADQACRLSAARPELPGDFRRRTLAELLLQVLQLALEGVEPRESHGVVLRGEVDGERLRAAADGLQ